MIPFPILLIGLATQKIHPSYEVWFRPEGIYFGVLAHQAMHLMSYPITNGVLTIQGPDGPEPVTLDPKSSSPFKNYTAQRIQIARSPNRGWRILTVSLKPSPIYTSVPETTYRIYLPAIDNRSYDETLRRGWVGKRVWLFGCAVDGPSDKTIVWNPVEPVTITGIKRISGPVDDRAGCPAWNGPVGFTGGSFYTSGYLEVSVRVPANARALGFNTENVHDMTIDDRTPLVKDRTAKLIVADGWQLLRVFSSHSPQTIIREQSHSIQNHFLKREIVKGMPRSLVAYLLGDPEPAYPADQVWRESEWSWSGPAPFTYNISFTKAGRVDKFGDSGMLP